jgi:lipopolysaccharide export system permease protein
VKLVSGQEGVWAAECGDAMRISDRYIGKQILLGTVYAVAVLSLVLVLGNLFKQVRPLLVEQRAPLSVVVRFVLNVLPSSLMFTLPWGFLSAVLLVFGRLSSGQEITAFRVGGMSLVRLAAPVFVIGAVLSGVCMYLNLHVVPTAKASVTELLYEEVKRDPSALLDPGVVQSSFENKKVFVERREGDWLIGFHFYQLPSEDGESSGSYLHARKAALFVDHEREQLRLKLEDAYIESARSDGGVEMAIMGKAEPLVFDFPAQRAKRKRASSMTNREILDFISGNQELESDKRVGFQTEITKRYSFSMACLAFAFVAVPLGLKARRQESSGGLIASLLLGAGYFLFTVLADEFETERTASLVLWSPNVLCVLVGCLLFWRARFK